MRLRGDDERAQSILVWDEYTHTWVDNAWEVDTDENWALVYVDGASKRYRYGDFHLYDARTLQPLEPHRAPKRAQIPRTKGLSGRGG